MRFLVVIALALSLMIGAGMAFDQAQSSVNRLFQGDATPTKPLELARVYAGSTKTVTRQPAQGRKALGQPRGGAQQKTSRPASVRRPS
jgi:hypothetical protein